MTKRLAPYVFIGGTSEPGGLHVHTADVAMVAALAGHPVTVVCPSVDHFSALFAGSPVRVQAVPPKARAESTLAYWWRVLAGHRHARAVFCRGKLAENTALDLLGIRLATRRLYTIEHRMIDDLERERPRLRQHGAAMRLLARRTLVVSEELAESAVRDLGLPRSMVATCINWVDPDFKPVTPAQRRAAKVQLGLPTDRLVIGYHGRIAPEKRLPALIDAFAQLVPPAGHAPTLVMVGEGWKRRELEELIRARQLGDRVHLTGWHANPRAALAAFDISVLPSLSEGFPLGLLEAMATGAACLAHPMSSTRQLIEPGRNGMLAALDEPAAFRNALQQLVDLAAEARAALGQAATETVARDYSRERRLPAVLEALDIQPPPGAWPTWKRQLEFAR